MVSGAASPIWPAAGIALACVLNAGSRMAPGIVIGVVAAYQLTGADIPLWSQLVIGAGNAAAAVLGATIITRIGGPRFGDLATLRSILVLVLASLVAGTVSALVGPTMLILAGKLALGQASIVYEGWFVGDAVGILLVAALILSWRSIEREDWQPRRMLHLLLVLLAVASLSWMVFFGTSVARAWSIYPALVWAALALQVRGTSAALVVATVIASTATLLGHGPFSPGGVPDLILLQQYLAVTCATGLLLAAAVHERNGEARLREVADAELRARAMVEDTQLKLTVAMEASRTGIWDWELATETVTWTRRCYEIHGVEPGMFDGTADAFRRLVHPDDVERLWDEVNGAIERREDYRTEFRIVRPDGAVRWVANSGQAQYAADGKPLRMIGTITDIHERRETEDKLTRLAERAEIAQQAARSSLYDYDPATGLVTRDPLIRDSAGYSAADLPNDHDSWERLIHPDDLAEFRSTVAQAMERADRYAMEYRILRKDGSIMWIADVGRVVRDEAGTARRIVGVATDITERKLAEEELHRTTQLLEQIGNSASGLIFAKDLQGRYLYCNQHVEQTTGRSFAELRGQDDAFWAKPDNARVYMENDQRVMHSGITEEVDEVAVAADGSRRLFRSVKAPLRDADGAVIGLVGIATDVTERKEAEEREQLLAREVDHRAKNLLAVVQSVVQMSRAEDIASFKDGVLGRIQSLARTHSLLAASRWDGVWLDQLLQDELAPFGTDDPDRLALKGPPVRLTPSAAQSLALVIHELATNAAKYGALRSRGGRLSVRWERPDANSPVELEWGEWTGQPAIAPAKSGFGSRLIRASVERQLGGELRSDWSDTGLRVELTVPARHVVNGPDASEEPSPSPQTFAATNVRKPGERCRVMVVEDETMIAVQLEQALEESGCQVIGVAASVEEALRIIDEERPGGAILDINLAGEKSYPVADRLRAAGVPFVFCTGYASEQVLPERFADAHLIRKPFDVRSVAALFAAGQQD